MGIDSKDLRILIVKHLQLGTRVNLGYSVTLDRHYGRHQRKFLMVELKNEK